MTNEQILKKAVKRALRNGYMGGKQIEPDYKGLTFYIPTTFFIIFSHSFAKAFWGTDIIGSAAMFFNGTDKPAWQYHLQQMVLELEPLRYLEKFL